MTQRTSRLQDLFARALTGLADAADRRVAALGGGVGEPGLGLADPLLELPLEREEARQDLASPLPHRPLPLSRPFAAQPACPGSNGLRAGPPEARGE